MTNPSIASARFVEDRKPRIGVVSGYMPYFEEIMPADFRAGMTRRAEDTAARLDGLGEVLFTGLVHDHESGFKAGRMLQDFDPDIVVIAPTMAAPAGYQYAAIRDLGRVPVILLDIHGLESIPEDYSAVSIVPNSVTVGCMMINNLLRRDGRWSPVVSGPAAREDTWQSVRAAIATVLVAGRLSKARFGVLGRPLDGYLNVVCDGGALQTATGAELVQVLPDEFTDAWRGVAEADIAALGAAFEAAYTIAVPEAEISQYRASLRLCLALETIVARHRLDGGTFNCRGEFSVANPEIGLIGCLANSHLTTIGRPFTCTGDLITAIAMFLGKQLGGDSYYCELDTPDYAADGVLCANTGEGDFCQAACGGSCTVRLSGSESGRVAKGCNVIYDMPERPGTAIAFTPRADAPGGHVIIAADGQIAGTPKTQLRLPSMLFRFAGGSVGPSMSRWIEAGATHHAGISSGHHADALEMIARIAGIGFDKV